METILILAASRDGLVVGDGGKRNLWLEFHKVDLKQGGKVEKNCYPKLRSWGMVGIMFLVKSKLCLAACTSKAYRGDEYACFLDLDSDSNSDSDSEWKHLPLPVRRWWALGALDGKIYGVDRYAADENLGSDWFDFIRDPLPEEEEEEEEYVMIPDPPNNRILFHVTSGNIYAYYPTHRESRLVAADVSHCHWSRFAAVVANIVYTAIHPRWCKRNDPWMLHAYDLSNGGKHLKCVWTSTEVDGVDIFDFLCDIHGFFHVPNTNSFWLATLIPDRSSSKLLHFVKFQASRAADGDDDRILCTPLDLVHSLLENTGHVFQFLLIHGSGSLNG